MVMWFDSARVLMGISSFLLVAQLGIAFPLVSTGKVNEVFGHRVLETRRNHRETATAISASSKVALGEPDLDGLPTDEISDPAYRDALQRIRTVDVPVPTSVSSAGTAGVSFLHWPAEPSSSTRAPLPLILVHGFDSSCLEFRRLGPKLAARGVDVYAVDLLGWGFTQLEGVDDFSAESKVETLKGFWRCVNGGEMSDCIVGGASLGGAAAIEFAAAAASSSGDENNPVKGMILIDAQGFVDGVGPMAVLPGPVARAGVQVLKSKPLRSSANQMSYHQPEVYATDDALRIGRLHTLRQGWEEGMLSFMASGGFTPVKKVPLCTMRSLILWGRQDGILDGKEFAPKFLEALPNADLAWIEECGHVPHLEQSDTTADVISEFMKSEEFQQFGGKSFSIQGLMGDAVGGGRSTSAVVVGAGAAAALGVVASSIAGSL